MKGQTMLYVFGGSSAGASSRSRATSFMFRNSVLGFVVIFATSCQLRLLGNRSTDGGTDTPPPIDSGRSHPLSVTLESLPVDPSSDSAMNVDVWGTGISQFKY